MSKQCDPRDWHWIVGGDTRQAWSSRLAAYVSDYPTDDVTRIRNEVELYDVLASRGMASRAPSRVFSAAEVRDALLFIDAAVTGDAATPEELTLVASAIGFHLPPMA